MNEEMQAIKENIRSGSFWEQWAYAKVLHMTKNKNKANKQSAEAEKARLFLYELYKNTDL